MACFLLFLSYRIDTKKVFIISGSVSIFVLLSQARLFPLETFIYVLFINLLPLAANISKRDFSDLAKFNLDNLDNLDNIASDTKHKIKADDAIKHYYAIPQEVADIIADFIAPSSFIRSTIAKIKTTNLSKIKIKK